MRVAISIVLAVLLAALAGLSGYASWNAERKAPMIGKRVAVNGASLHVFETGNRQSALPPVVLIHGASVNLRDMEMSLGRALAADRRVLMIDRPGRGYSERPVNGYQLDVQSAYIHDAVQALGYEKPLIVGQSLGGAVALNYALNYQDEISGLVLLAPVSHEWPGGVAWYNSASEIPVIGFLLRRLVIPVYGYFVAEKGIAESFAPDTPPPGYYERSGLALLFRAGDFRNNAADIANLKSEIRKQQGRYGELKLPVAILTGTSDSTVSPDIHSKALGREIAGASLKLLPDTGHALHHAETAAIVDVINGLSGAAEAGAP